MSITKLFVSSLLLLSVASASLVAIRATNWNGLGIYTIDKASGIIGQTSMCG